eukprot:TRINITY_DN67_c0_g1_i3.p1 TRINITY_DN67_c0_g1~~TRINITY_DN67_c0_g1_i3.p1  ORF type:complete len:622 (-),score=110.81 TRINITY_DN67_c0_g1_i3:170-2035(-)
MKAATLVVLSLALIVVAALTATTTAQSFSVTYEEYHGNAVISDDTLLVNATDYVVEFLGEFIDSDTGSEVGWMTWYWNRFREVNSTDQDDYYNITCGVGVTWDDLKLYKPIFPQTARRDDSEIPDLYQHVLQNGSWILYTCGGGPLGNSPSPSPSVSGAPSDSPSPSPSPSPSVSGAPSDTPSPSDSPLASESPSPSTSPGPSDSATPSVTPSLSETPSVTPSLSESPSPSPTPSVTPSITPSLSESPSPSPTPSVTPSITPSLSESPTPSVTPSETPSITPSLSESPSPSVTPSITPSSSDTPSITPSLSESPSPSMTPTASPSVSPAPSDTPSPSTSPAISPTPSVSPTPSPSESATRSPSQTPSTSPSRSVTPSPSPINVRKRIAKTGGKIKRDGVLIVQNGVKADYYLMNYGLKDLSFGASPDQLNLEVKRNDLVFDFGIKDWEFSSPKHFLQMTSFLTFENGTRVVNVSYTDSGSVDYITLQTSDERNSTWFISLPQYCLIDNRVAPLGAVHFVHYGPLNGKDLWIVNMFVPAFNETMKLFGHVGAISQADNTHSLGGDGAAGSGNTGDGDGDGAHENLGVAIGVPLAVLTGSVLLVLLTAVVLLIVLGLIKVKFS